MSQPSIPQYSQKDSISPYKNEYNKYATPIKKKILGSTGKLSEFTPSKSYLHERLKFSWKKKQKCDRVKVFQLTNSIWQADPFLRNSYK